MSIQGGNPINLIIFNQTFPQPNTLGGKNTCHNTLQQHTLQHLKIFKIHM
jgi:hypothetical protein